MRFDEASARRISHALRMVQEMWDELHRRKLNPILMRQYSDAISVLEDDFKARLPNDVTVVYGASAPQTPCTVCGLPPAQHGTYPTCATHPYTAGVGEVDRG